MTTPNAVAEPPKQESANPEMPTDWGKGANPEEINDNPFMSPDEKRKYFESMTGILPPPGETPKASAKIQPVDDETRYIETLQPDYQKPEPPKSRATTTTKGKRKRPIFGLCYGLPGVGKSTWASGAPGAIFSPLERGTDQLDIESFPRAKTHEEFIEQMDFVQYEKHGHYTFVVDTADALETLIWAKVCKEYKCKSIEDPGYGKGFNRAKEILQEDLSRLTEISERMHVLILAHATVKAFNDPSLSVPYDCWSLALHPKAADALKRAVDTILFAAIKVDIEKATIKDKKGRGVISEERVLITQPTTGLDCKNRFNLPAELPLKWSNFGDAVKTFYANPTTK